MLKWTFLLKHQDNRYHTLNQMWHCDQNLQKKQWQSGHRAFKLSCISTVSKCQGSKTWKGRYMGVGWNWYRTILWWQVIKGASRTLLRPHDMYLLQYGGPWGLSNAWKLAGHILEHGSRQRLLLSKLVFTTAIHCGKKKHAN